MEYELISVTQPNIFKTEVNGYLRHGWRLHGPTFIDPHNGALCQAVVKETREQWTNLMDAIAATPKEEEAA